MVMDNICHLLNNFLHCSAYETILFGWVMHQQSIIDTLLKNLDTENCRILCISLLTDEVDLRRRLLSDIKNGQRNAEIIDRSIARLPLYQSLHTIKIDTRGKVRQRNRR